MISLNEFEQVCYFLFFLKCSTKYRTTAIIKSQAFLPKNPITSPAVLNRKLTMAPTIPGNISPSFFPIVFNPLPTPLPNVDRPFERLETITPMTTPTALKTAKTVKPYFLNIMVDF